MKNGELTWTPADITNLDIYSNDSDIYSYGMVLYEIFSGKYPFEHFEDEEVNLKYVVVEFYF